MKRTTNYALPTWEKSDFIQMSDFNDLTQKTDAALKANADAAGGKADGVIGGSSSIKLYELYIGRDVTQDEGVTVLAESSAGKNWNTENIIAFQPDLIVCSTAMSGYKTISAPAQAAGIPVGPAKAANAGGVSTSALEMTQNSMRLSWTFEEVDERLHNIMRGIYKAAYDASVEAGQPGNLVVGANIASFLKIADAMLHQGIV